MMSRHNRSQTAMPMIRCVVFQCTDLSSRLGRKIIVIVVAIVEYMTAVPFMKLPSSLPNQKPLTTKMNRLDQIKEYLNAAPFTVEEMQAALKWLDAEEFYIPSKLFIWATALEYVKQNGDEKLLAKYQKSFDDKVDEYFKRFPPQSETK